MTMLLVLVFAAMASTQNLYAAQKDQDNDGIPDVAEQLLGTNPLKADTDGDGILDLQDKSPAFLENPIVSHASQVGFKIVEAMVEDNYDQAKGRDAQDHLEVKIKNVSNQDLNGFEVYYTIKDLKSNKIEGYYYKLPDLIIKKGTSETIHFDNENRPLHFGENSNSIYRSSTAEKNFHVIVSANGFKPVSVDIHKDKGGAETAD